MSGRREPVFSGDVKNSELMAFLQVGRKCRNANGFSRELIQPLAFLRGEKKTNEYLLYTRIFNDRLSSFLDKSEQKK